MNENDNSLTSQKWVRVMCDFSATGIWNRQGQSCELSDLPAYPIVITMLKGWQAWYEFSTGCPESRWFDIDAHAKFGLFIARVIKNDLPDWTVIYHDESRAVEDGPEYEITLDA